MQICIYQNVSECAKMFNNYDYNDTEFLMGDDENELEYALNINKLFLTI